MPSRRRQSARNRAHDRGLASMAAFNRKHKPLTNREVKAIASEVLDDTLGGVKPSRAAQACVSREIAKHCRKKRGQKTCKVPAVQAQAAAIGFAVCRRKGHRSIPKR